MSVALSASPFSLYASSLSAVPSTSSASLEVSIDNVTSEQANVYMPNGNEDNLLFHGVRADFSNGQSSYDFASDISVDALSIRQTMALQRFKERLLRAGTRTKDLQRALFGDVSRYVLDDYVDFLGATSSNLDFNTVAATAESNGVNVGDLSSNGVSTVSNNGFSYHSSDYGILIGVCYFIPENEYEAYGIDRFNVMLDSDDYYKPDFANLGLSPVFNFDYNLYFGSHPVVSAPSDGAVDLTKVDSVLGYLARYWQYKTSIDKVHGEFYNSLPWRSGLSVELSQNVGFEKKFSQGAFASFVAPRPATLFTDMGLSVFYVNPSDIDSIFYVAANEMQESDHFKINMYNNCRAVLPMSVIGLPQ